MRERVRVDWCTREGGGACDFPTKKLGNMVTTKNTLPQQVCCFKARCVHKERSRKRREIPTKKKKQSAVTKRMGMG